MHAFVAQVYVVEIGQPQRSGCDRLPDSAVEGCTVSFTIRQKIVDGKFF